MDDCLFCKIIAGDIPSAKVYEDEYDYAFRDIYLLASAADTDEKTMEGPKKAMEGWVVCFEKTRLCGVVQALGVTESGDIRKTPAALDAARDMGRSIR